MNQDQADQDLWVLRKPDWEKWKHEKQARLWHAVALACDMDPSNFSLFDAPELSRLLRTPPQAFDDLIALAKGSLGAGGILKLVSKSDLGLEESDIKLAVFRKWAESIGTVLPSGFPGCAAPKQAPEEEKAVEERERTTLLVLIAALAHEAGIDISKPSKAAGLIEGLTLRINARVAARTIENHLKRIPAALEKSSS